MIAGDFMDPEFPFPEYNVPAELGGSVAVWNGSQWVMNGRVARWIRAFVNLTYYGAQEGDDVPPRSSTDIANGPPTNGPGSGRTVRQDGQRDEARVSRAAARGNFPGPPYHIGGPGTSSGKCTAHPRVFEQELTAAGVP